MGLDDFMIFKIINVHITKEMIIKKSYTTIGPLSEVEPCLKHRRIIPLNSSLIWEIIFQGA